MAEVGTTGLVADDAEYIAFQPPRYFSSKQLKLRFKGNIETKEYMTRELLKGKTYNIVQHLLMLGLVMYCGGLSSFLVSSQVTWSLGM